MIRRNVRTIHLAEIIHKNPGIRFREIMRLTGMKNGIISHHIQKLENSNIIRVERKPGQTNLFPIHVNEYDSKIIKQIKHTTNKKILLALLKEKDQCLQHKDFVKILGKAPSTISCHLSQLLDDKIIRIKFVEFKKKYCLVDKKLVDRVIDMYHPSILERATSGLEDIVNSL